MKCLHISISGKIQGEGLRFRIVHLAFKHHIKGYVKYNSPSEIIIEAEGEEKLLDQFIESCRASFETSQINIKNVQESSKKGYQSFEIQHIINEETQTTAMFHRWNFILGFTKRYLKKFQNKNSF